MTGIEIFLIIVGVIALAISFFGDKIFENKEETNSFDNKFNDEIIQQKVSAAIDGIIDEKVESTEIKIEKILNEKIMTVGEYSDNVISEIDKNHNEVMFLYGMLNDKEKEVKNTLIDIENIKKSIKKIEVEKENKAQEKNVITEKTDENKSEEKKNIRSNSGRNNQGKANLSKNNSAKNVTSKQSKNSNSTKQEKDKKNNNERILEMYKQGKEPMEIAKDLKLGIGEVRLVLDLFKNKQ